MIIMSRTFLDGAETVDQLEAGFDLADEVRAVRAAIEAAVHRTPAEVEAQQREAQQAIWETARQMRARNRA